MYALTSFGSAHYYLQRHLQGIAIGLLGLLSMQCVSLRMLRVYSPLFFVSSVFLTALTLIPGIGHVIHGSARWLSIAGFSLQPSEILKIGLLLYVAAQLAKQKERDTQETLRGYFPIIIALCITTVLLLRQPDFGLTVTLAGTIFILMFIAHTYVRYMLYTFCMALPFAIFLILIKPYRLKRVITFLNPWKDPQGSGFQIIQSLIAIGSGGWGGLGIAQSKQKFFYLPMQHTDFIFSIIAEETGLIGCIFLIIVLITFLYSGLQMSTRVKTTFNSLVIAAFVTLISLQALINIAVANGMLPTKGIGLPFVSYGNSALIAHLVMVGIIIRCVRNEQET